MPALSPNSFDAFLRGEMPAFMLGSSTQTTAFDYFRRGEVFPAGLSGLIHEASGGLFLSGSSDVASSYWTYDASGVIRLSNTTVNYIPTYIYSIASGLVTFRDSTGPAQIVTIAPFQRGFDYYRRGEPLAGVGHVWEFSWFRSNSPIRSVLANHIRATGGIVLNGGIGPVVSSSWHYTASGGMVIGSSAPQLWLKEYLPSGGLRLTGNPIYGHIYVTPDASGVLRFSNEAIYRPTYLYPMSGSIAVTGSAAQLWYRAFLPSGGLRLTGNPDYGHTYVTPDASGVLRFSNEAIYRPTYLYPMSGSIRLSGDTGIPHVTHVLFASGDLRLSNEAFYRPTYLYPMNGGIATYGTADSGSTHVQATGAGGMRLSNEAIYRPTYLYPMNGGMRVANNDSDFMVHVAPDASGVIRLNPNAVVQPTYNYDIASGVMSIGGFSIVWLHGGSGAVYLTGISEYGHKFVPTDVEGGAMLLGDTSTYRPTYLYEASGVVRLGDTSSVQVHRAFGSDGVVRFSGDTGIPYIKHVLQSGGVVVLGESGEGGITAWAAEGEGGMRLGDTAEGGITYVELLGGGDIRFDGVTFGGRVFDTNVGGGLFLEGDTGDPQLGYLYQGSSNAFSVVFGGGTILQNYIPEGGMRVYADQDIFNGSGDIRLAGSATVNPLIRGSYEASGGMKLGGIVFNAFGYQASGGMKLDNLFYSRFGPDVTVFDYYRSGEIYGGQSGKIAGIENVNYNRRSGPFRYPISKYIGTPATISYKWTTNQDISPCQWVFMFLPPFFFGQWVFVCPYTPLATSNGAEVKFSPIVEASGSIRISNGADYVFTVNMSGGVATSNGATYDLTYYRTSSGHIRTTGSAIPTVVYLAANVGGGVQFSNGAIVPVWTGIGGVGLTGTSGDPAVSGSYPGQGGMTLGFSAQLHYEYSASGIVRTGGIAFGAIAYEGSGSLFSSGTTPLHFASGGVSFLPTTAETARSPRAWMMVGRVRFSGSAETARSPRAWMMTGRARLSGTAEVLRSPRMWMMTGGIRTTGTCEVVRSPRAWMMTGGMRVRVSHEFARSPRAWMMVGRMLIGQRAANVTAASILSFVYTATGGVKVTETTATARLRLTYRPSGVVRTNSRAIMDYYGVDAVGGIRLSSSALRHYEFAASGRVRTSGAAHAAANTWDHEASGSCRTGGTPAVQAFYTLGEFTGHLTTSNGGRYRVIQARFGSGGLSISNSGQTFLVHRASGVMQFSGSAEYALQPLTFAARGRVTIGATFAGAGKSFWDYDASGSVRLKNTNVAVALSHIVADISGGRVLLQSPTGKFYRHTIRYVSTGGLIFASDTRGYIVNKPTGVLSLSGSVSDVIVSILHNATGKLKLTGHFEYAKGEHFTEATGHIRIIRGTAVASFKRHFVYNASGVVKHSNSVDVATSWWEDTASGSIRIIKSTTAVARMPLYAYVSQGGVVSVSGQAQTAKSLWDHTASGSIRIIKSTTASVMLPFYPYVSQGGVVSITGQAHASCGYWEYEAVPEYSALSYPHYNAMVSGLGPVAWWKLNETSGTSANDEGIADSDGTYVAPVTLGVKGLVQDVGTAVRFADDGHVTVPSDVLINGSVRSKRSICLWFNAEDTQARQVLYKEGDINSGFVIYIYQGKVYVGAYNSPSPSQWNSYLSANILANKSHFVALTFSSNPALIGYLDGVSIGTGAVASAVSAHPEAIIAGKINGTRYHTGRSSGDGHYFTGVLQHVVVYNDVLTPTQIASLHDAGTNVASYTTLPVTYTGSGRMTVGETAYVENIIGRHTGTGAVRLGSAATTGSQYNFVYNASGRVQINVTHSVDRIYSSWEHEASGGERIDGTAFVRQLRVFESQNGQLLLSGTATVSIHVSVSAIGSGRVVFYGDPSYFSNAFGFDASGGVRLDAVVDSGLLYEAEGGYVRLHGSSLCEQITNHIASGGMRVGSNAALYFDLEITKDFTWNISESIMRFFRVTGKCKPSECPPLSGNCPSDSMTNFTTTVLARSAKEVCKILAKRNFNAPIKQIEMFSLPAFEKDILPTDDRNCNKLIPVPLPSYKDCPNQIDVQAKVGGQSGAYAIETFPYAGAGTIRFSGSALVSAITPNWDYDASGKVFTFGDATANASDQFRYSASGDIKISGECEPGNLGVLKTGMLAKVSSTGKAIFGKAVATELTPEALLVNSLCCLGNLPEQIFVTHDIARSPLLARYLQVNNFVVPKVVKLVYSSKHKTWYNSLHYSGTSANGGRETWDILFELGCINQVVGSKAWRFSVSMSNRHIDKKESSVTKLLVIFDPSRICEPKSGINFTFTFNTTTKRAAPATLQTSVFHDNMSAFKGGTFIKNPLLKFTIASSPQQQVSGEIDITSHIRDLTPL